MYAQYEGSGSDKGLAEVVKIAHFRKEKKCPDLYMKDVVSPPGEVSEGAEQRASLGYMKMQG